MKIGESKRRYFGWRKMKQWIVGCSVLSVLLLLMLVYTESWTEPAQVLIFAGLFHPVFLHLPIGMLVIVGMMEVIAKMRMRKSHATMPLSMATLTSVIAVLFGYLLMRTNTYPEDSIDAHLWSGVVFTVFLVWTLFFKLRFNETGKGQKVYWWLLGISTALMFATGHYGGIITHGDPLDQAPWVTQEKRAKGANRQAGSQLGQQLIYEDILVPILEEKCYKCHGPKKKKGGLRMDSYEALLEGGDEGPSLVPGDVSKSLMIEFITLPLDDEYRMPPEDKPQLTEAETEVLKWWVESGAPRKTTVSSLEIPEPIKEALADIAGKGAVEQEQEGSPEASKSPAAGAHHGSQASQQAIQIRQQYADQVKALQQQYPGVLTWVSQSDATLSLNTAGMRSSFTDADFKKFQPLAGLFSQIDLTAANVSDVSAPVLKSMTHLSSLRLSETKVTDDIVPVLAELKGLETLSLYGTSITDVGINQLASLTQLKRLYLWQSKVSADGVNALKVKLPDCVIDTGVSAN